jgi:hypothetical protein
MRVVALNDATDVPLRNGKKLCRLPEFHDYATVLAPRRTSSMNIDNAEKRFASPLKRLREV